MKVVVFGATGVIGRAAAERFGQRRDCEVLAVSRRSVDLPGVVHVPLDLTDADASAAMLRSRRFDGTTHVVFAALQESPELASGWQDARLIDRNEAMFRNALEPLATACDATLQHVSLLQGAKAYGFHVGRSPVPGKEGAPRDPHRNFYFAQEDILRAFADAAPWSWTIFRPQVVYGQSFGSPMNLVPVLGVYAALEREAGRALSFPGTLDGVHEAVDARMLARALAWAAEAPAARDEIFNVTNGDVFSWRDVWPSIAAVFDMEVGEPVAQRLAQVMPPRASEWADLVARHRLEAPADMATFVGGSWTYADILFGGSGRSGPPALLSTIKIRQAGFGECIDTGDMLCDWLQEFQARRFLPR